MRCEKMDSVSKFRVQYFDRYSCSYHYLISQIANLYVHYKSNACAGILEQSMGARNRVGIGLSYRPARLQRLAGSIHWNRFLGSLKV